jgi:hypothetical protein
VVPPSRSSDQPEPDFSALPHAATLRFATSLVQDGVSGVTVVLPRRPHVLAQARETAAEAGVEVRVEQIGRASMTLRFVAHSASRRAPGSGERTTRRARGWRFSALAERWGARLLGWASSVRRRRR